jgi:serine/threonine protein phosphatase PrpC
MKVESIYDQGVGIMNEDQIVSAEPVFAVLDGATSLNKFVDTQGKTGGYLASSLVAEYFRTHTGTLVERAQAANIALRQEMQKQNIDMSQKENLWITSLSAVQINQDTIDWIQVGDCFILFIFFDGTYKLASEYFDHDEQVLKKFKLLGNMDQKEKWNELYPDMLALRRSQNIVYGVVNGEVEAENFFRRGSFLRDTVAHVLLFTDGFLIPKEDVGGEENFDLCVKTYLTQGLLGLKTLIREMEESDPACLKYTRYKKHDDIAALSITLEKT